MTTSLAVVLDAWSRRIVGWAMATHLRTELVFDFIEGWYNPHRRHSALAYESPINYERKVLSDPKCESVHLSTEPG